MPANKYEIECRTILSDAKIRIPYLVIKSEYAEIFAMALKIFQKENLLKKYIAVFRDYDDFAYFIAKVLKHLQNANLFNREKHKENLAILCQFGNYSTRVENATRILLEGNALIQETFDAIYTVCQRNEFPSGFTAFLNLARGLVTLHNSEILNERTIAVLCQFPLSANVISCGWQALLAADQFTPKNVDNIIKLSQYYDNHLQFANWLKLLNKINLLSEDNLTSLAKNAIYIEAIIDGSFILHDADIERLAQDTLEIFCQYAKYATWIANELRTLHFLGFLDQFKQKQDFSEVLCFLNLAKIENKDFFKLATFSTKNDIYQYIIDAEDSTQFNKYSKTAAFFLAYREILKKPLHPEIKPESVPNHLKKILQKLGGYSFMPDDEKNITIGIEIEYTNIPVKYALLLEFVMDCIQKKWSHPGDGSVTPEGESCYGGEATTPIISNNKELMAAMLNIVFLQAMGATTNQSCGMHVHIGVDNIKTPEEFEEKEVKDDGMPLYTEYQLEFIKQFLMIYEREAKKFNSIERELNSYAKAVKLPENMQHINKLSELIKKVNPVNRNFEINLHAFLLHGTIEVRRFAGTTKESDAYATVAMISAMAKEAKMRTNIAFKKPEAKETAPLTAEEKEARPLSYAELSFFYRQTTEHQRELFMLRVKAINETKLIITTKNRFLAKSKLSNNTVYVYLVQNNKIAYKFYDKNDKEISGIIANDKRFNNIIQKIKHHKYLDQREQNLILLEVSAQAPALISHRVEKLKSETPFSANLRKCLMYRK